MPATLIITPLTVDLDVGATIQLAVSPSSNGVKWSCSACNVASVSNTGLVTGLAEGTAYITGRRGNQTVTVTVTVIDVNPPDIPPPPPPTVVLTATAGQTEDDTWTFSTNGTVPGLGDMIVQSIITFGDGSSPTTYTGAPPVEIDHNWLIGAGTYTVTLAVETAEGYADDASFQAIVEDVPSPPPPDPTPNTSPVAALAFVSGQYTNQVVTFSTAGTYDLEGPIVSHTIDYGDGTVNTIATPPAATLTHLYTVSGTYTARLTVRDEGGLEGTATVSVTVVTAPTVNQPPVPVLAKTSGSFAGDTYTFSTVGSVDPDGTIVSWRFEPGTGAVQTASGAPPSQLTAPYPSAGSFTARLTVTDNSGESRSATVTVIVSTVPAGGTYAYYDSMVARPERIAAFSLRSQSQLLTNSGASAAPWVVYDAVIDAAKVTIPPFLPDVETTLASGIDSSTTTLTFSSAVTIQNQRPYKIDNEVVIADRVSPGVFQFLRGQYGTTPASHLSGASVYRGCSSLISQVRLPLNLLAGYTYFLGWEFRHTAELQEKSYKAWQHSNAPNQRIWYEINNNKPELSGGFGARAYGIAGANMTDRNPMSPRIGAFTIAADRWSRAWTFLDLRPATPLFSLWAGDSVQGIVQCFSLLQQEYITSTTVDQWWIEYNTSTNTSDSLLRTLTGWTRNFFVLRGLAETAVPLSIAGL